MTGRLLPRPGESPCPATAVRSCRWRACSHSAGRVHFGRGTARGLGRGAGGQDPAPLVARRRHAATSLASARAAPSSSCTCWPAGCSPQPAWPGPFGPGPPRAPSSKVWSQLPAGLGDTQCGRDSPSVRWLVAAFALALPGRGPGRRDHRIFAQNVVPLPAPAATERAARLPPRPPQRREPCARSAAHGRTRPARTMKRYNSLKRV